MPENNNLTPTLREVIDGAIEERLAHVHTWMPAVVKSYDADLQVVDAQPQVYAPTLQPDGTFKYEQLAVCFRCPVGFPGVAGGFRMTYPIPEGATGMLLFSEQPLDEWFEQGTELTPTVPRRHDITDAMFVPMLRAKMGAFKDAGADAMTLGSDGGPQVVVTRNGVELGGNPSNPASDFAALASKVNANFDALKIFLTSLSLPVSGTAAGPPAPGSVPAMQDVGSTVVKAK